jgi:CBS domain-containing protein
MEAQSTNKLVIGDIVNRNSCTIRMGATMGQAAELVSESQTSDLMVVDGENIFIGVLSEGDLIRAVVPNMDELLNTREGSLAKAYEVFLGLSDPARGSQPIDRYIIRQPITLHPQDELLKAAIVTVSRQIRRLPVVESRKFLGTVSRADICRAILNRPPTPLPSGG